ncbi:MAG: Nucleoside ABC transporter membrane protein [Acetothermia bacterium 64_32]|nr:MAG: Nucleoside ABC transporter membrane protein [Acetothermia bacterium 64_32]HAF70961.1 ABC transporter permease [Candidatus Acetothermia bacterium]
MKRFGPFLLERRLAPPRGVVLGVSVLAVVLALLVGAVIFAGYGVDPWHAYATIAKSTLGSRYGLMEILRRTIPLLLCGVGLVISFRAQFWNIGAEGQLLAGAVAATGVALFSGIPRPWLLPAMFGAGFLAGAIWGMIPAFLKVKLKVNDVISTLMMNYIMIYIVEWLIHGPWKGPTMRGFAYTDTFSKAGWLPLLPLSRVHWPTLVIGVAAAVLAALVLARTRLGYEVRVVGESEGAARYAGINFLRVSLAVMLLSGGLAGLAGVGEVAGIHHKLLSPTQVSMNYGYTAIIVAWLARGSPLAAIVTSLLFGLIFAAGDVIKVSLRMPFQVTGVFNGLILFFLIGVELLMYWRVKLSPKGEGWTGKAGSSGS